MRKYSFSVLVVLLCAVFVFSGCTKASTATPSAINTLYQTTAKKYGKYHDGDANSKTKVFDAEMFVDLYSAKAYENSVYQNITRFESDASYSVVNLLQKDGEYEPIMSAVSNFYNYRNFIASNIDIKQSLLSDMYQAVDDLDESAKTLLSKKESFETLLASVGNPNSIPVAESLKSYLQSYRVFIQKMFKVNAVYEEIYTSYIYVPQDNTTRLMGGELQRLVLSSELYLAEYYFNKQFVLNSSYDNRFAHKKIYDAESGSVANNENYDSDYEAFVKIVNNTTNVADPENLNDPDYLSYYNAAVSKLKSLKVNINNYKIAAEKIAEYKKQHKTDEIPANSNVYQYVNFVNEMQYQIESYQNYLLLNIMDMA